MDQHVTTHPGKPSQEFGHASLFLLRHVCRNAVDGLQGFLPGREYYLPVHNIRLKIIAQLDLQEVSR